MYVRTVALIIGLVAALAALAGPASAGTPLPDQRIDMRVLLLSADGNEPAYQAWRAQLEREGVPFDAIVATPGEPHHVRAARGREGSRPLPGGRPGDGGARLLRRHLVRLGARGIRVGRHQRVRAHVRDPAGHGVRVPVAGVRAQLADRRQLDGRHRRLAHPGCPAALRVPEGPGRLRRQRLGLPGDAGRPGQLPDVRQRPERLFPRGRLHPPGRS